MTYLWQIHERVAPAVFIDEAAGALTKAERQKDSAVGQGAPLYAKVMNSPPVLIAGFRNPLLNRSDLSMLKSMRNNDDGHNTSEIAIFGRLIQADRGNLSPLLARYVLKLGFLKADQERMQDLAARNQEGALSGKEKEELANFVKAGHLLALLHSKARKSLRKKAS